MKGFVNVSSSLIELIDDTEFIVGYIEVKTSEIRKYRQIQYLSTQ